MKKLMMTTVAALGFAVCAKAEVLNSTGFEDYDGNPFAIDASDSGTSGSGTQYWTGSAEADFSQTVLKQYGDDNAPTNVPDVFKDAAANTTYLSVDTGNDVMYRRVYASGAQMTSFDISESPVFFDADVKFTASETDVSTPSEGDKLLVWLKADTDNETTNLVVTAGLYNGTSGAYDKTNFADTWYRLTVKADVVEDITTFVVYINGTAVTGTFDGTTVTSFPSLVESDSDAGKLIESAGFQGTGALDNVVWTKDNPFPPEETYTLEITIDDEEGNLSEIKVNGTAYEIDGEASLEIPFLASTETLEIEIDIFEGYGIEGWDGLTKTITVAGALEEGKITLPLKVVADERTAIEGATVVYSIDSNTITVGNAAPTVQSVTVNNTELTLDTDYTVTTVGSVAEAGTYTLIITGKGDYKGMITKVFTVEAAEPDVPTEAETTPGTPAQVKADTKDAAEAAVSVKGVDGTVYEASQKYYTKSAVETETAGVFDVTVRLNENALEEDVDDAVEAALADVVGNAETKAITLPAGFYYKIESGNSVGLTDTPRKGTSTGAAITMPTLSGDAGFFKVSVGTTEF